VPIAQWPNGQALCRPVGLVRCLRLLHVISGHSAKSDVSEMLTVGCVCGLFDLQMLTGVRPWHEYRELQIIYQVGAGCA
jgi:hypothetical protein